MAKLLQFKAYVLNVMTFGASCSSMFSHAIKNLNAKRFAEKTANAVRDKHFLDDYLDSFPTEEEAILTGQTYTQTIRL